MYSDAGLCTCTITSTYSHATQGHAYIYTYIMYTYISQCYMYNSKNHRNHNRSFFPSVLDHSRRWRSVAPVDTDEKRAPRAAVPPVAKLLAHHHLALPASTFTNKRLAEKATQALRRKCEVQRHNRKESEEKEEARSSESFGITFQGVGGACPQSSLAPSQNSISKDTGVRRTFVHLCCLK